MNESRSPGRGWFFVLAMLMACFSTFPSGLSIPLSMPGPSHSQFAAASFQRARMEAGLYGRQSLSGTRAWERAQNALAIEEQESQSSSICVQLRPYRRATVSHPAAHRLLSGKLPSEMASRTGGHAPPYLNEGAANAL